jgi:hypothetical protein
MREVLCVVLIWIIAVEMVMFSRAIPYQMAETNWKQKQAEEANRLKSIYGKSVPVSHPVSAVSATSE